jgi:hypothetical protein
MAAQEVLAMRMPEMTEDNNVIENNGCYSLCLKPFMM